jgi:cytochrome c553
MLLLAPTVASAAEPAAAVRLAEFRAAVAPLVKAHCIACHGPDTQEGDVRLDQLLAETDFNRQAKTLQAMRDQLRDGLMPPPDEPRPDDAQVRAAVAALTAMNGSIAPRLPNEGNLVPHELLFGKPANEGQPSAQRIWRLSPDGYFGFVREVHRGRHEGIVQPFSAVPDRGIKDFATRRRSSRGKRCTRSKTAKFTRGTTRWASS